MCSGQYSGAEPVSLAPRWSAGMQASGLGAARADQLRGRPLSCPCFLPLMPRPTPATRSWAAAAVPPSPCSHSVGTAELRQLLRHPYTRLPHIYAIAACPGNINSKAGRGAPHPPCPLPCPASAHSRQHVVRIRWRPLCVAPWRLAPGQPAAVVLRALGPSLHRTGWRASLRRARLGAPTGWRCAGAIGCNARSNADTAKAWPLAFSCSSRRPRSLLGRPR